jgi:glycosyltransferase involved in cell wall biosynthesis
VSAPAGPLVSIVLPVLNASRFLEQALASVTAQAYLPNEIVAVDGGSTDGTLDTLAAAPRARVLRQAGQGLPAAWNEGIAAARGQYVCFLDADDLWPANRLDLQIRHLEAQPEALFCIGHVMLFLEPGCRLPATLNPAALAGSHLGHMPGTLMARRALFDQVGVFEMHWRIASDIEWFARLRDAHVPGVELSDVLLYRRIHDANLSQLSGPRLIQGELLQMLRQGLRRRRAAQESRRVP